MARGLNKATRSASNGIEGQPNKACLWAISVWGLSILLVNDVLNQNLVRAFAHLMIAAFTAETQDEASVYKLLGIRVMAELSEEEQEEAVEIAGRCMATDFDC